MADYPTRSDTLTQTHSHPSSLRPQILPLTTCSCTLYSASPCDPQSRCMNNRANQPMDFPQFSLAAPGGIDVASRKTASSTVNNDSSARQRVTRCIHVHTKRIHDCAHGACLQRGGGPACSYVSGGAHYTRLVGLGVRNPDGYDDIMPTPPPGPFRDYYDTLRISVHNGHFLVKPGRCISV